MVEVELSRLLINEGVDEQYVFLREKSGERSLSIAVGIFEALALDLALKGRGSPRPLTHELLHDVVSALGSRLERVAIHTLEEGTFFASLSLVGPEGLIEVDARPSDALTLAQLEGAPVFVDSAILDEVGTPRTPWE